MIKTLALLAALVLGAGSLRAADFTVAIEEEPVGPLAQWYLDYNLRKHVRLRETQQAIRHARYIPELREKVREEENQLLLETLPSLQEFQKRGVEQARWRLEFEEKQLKWCIERIAEATKPKKKKSLKQEEEALRLALEKLSQK